MRDDSGSSSPPLDDFQSYLLLLARAQLDGAGGAGVDPQDAVQQTLLKAHRKRHQFRGQSDGELAAWLRTILANHLSDLFRKEGRALDEQALANKLEQSSLRLGQFLAAEQSSPSQRVAKGERLQRLAEALMQLPDDQRRAVELRHLQGLSLAEIAEQMQRSLASVGGLLQRGLKGLRKELNR